MSRANDARLKKMDYPNTRVVYYNYWHDKTEKTRDTPGTSYRYIEFRGHCPYFLNPGTPY